MSGGIFLLQSGGELVEMKERAYDSEDVFQDLLARYPHLLAGDQMDGNSPRRWLFISREMGVPADEGACDRWSLDHLFLDQDGVPTLVEVKRSTDTRIRREVIGQMLDYAANAVVYWPVETIQTKFEAGCQKRATDSVKELEAFLGDQSRIDDFWQGVKVNLQAGKIRMVFVADEIPSELRRIVEFLNGQMDPAEVLAVEIKQYVGQGLKTLVPRVIGLTTEAERKKSAGGRSQRQWDETSFLETLTQKKGSQDTEIARAILSWARKNDLRIWWGRGTRDGSFYPMFDWKGKKHSVIAVWTYGRVAIQFGLMKDRPPFDSDRKREELRDKLIRIPGIEIGLDSIALFPSIPISALASSGARVQFLEVLDWFLEEVKAQEVKQALLEKGIFHEDVGITSSGNSPATGKT